MKRLSRQSGQVGMTVLLVMVVMVTVAVAVASRSVSNLSLTRREQESTRSLDLAESGIDQLLNRDTGDVVMGTTYKMFANKEVYVAANEVRAFESLPVEEGHAVEVALTGANELDLSWETNATCVAGNPDGIEVVEVTLIKGESDDYATKKTAYTGCSGNPNGFTTVFAAGEERNKLDIPVSGYQLARIKVLGVPVVLTVGGDLPRQGTMATATASDTEEVTASLTKIKYDGFRPSIFDYAVFSGNTIDTN